MEARKQRALKIIETGAVRPDPDRDQWWLVPSQTGVGGYQVHLPTDGRAPTCTCKDFEKPKVHFCKHIFAAEMAKGRLFVDSERVKGEYVDNRDFKAVNAAHENEKDHVLRLAHELCRGIEEPKQTRGRPRLLVKDVVYAALIWVYGKGSGRCATYDLRVAKAHGMISHAMHWGSMMRCLKNPALTPLLRTLLRETALPMRHIERRFAIDASGFSTRAWHRWYDHKWGKAHQERIWLKAHAICGVDTMIVTDCVIANEGDADTVPRVGQEHPRRLHH